MARRGVKPITVGFVEDLGAIERVTKKYIYFKFSQWINDI